jgi:hypothetical protein
VEVAPFLTTFLAPAGDFFFSEGDFFFSVVDFFFSTFLAAASDGRMDGVEIGTLPVV